VFWVLLPNAALAWWNKDWTQRTAVTLNTSAAGVPTQESLSDVAVPLRLHSGNFDFVGAKADGSDLRVLAGDDKTPLKFWIERFDSVNELGVIWVLVPSVLPATDKNTIYIYGGNDKASADANAPGNAAAVADAATLAAFHFAEKDGIATDQTGTVKASAAVAVEANGLIGQSVRLNGTPIIWPASDKIKTPSAGPFSVSLWVRPDASQGTLFSQGSLQLALAAGALTAKVGTLNVSGGQLAPATWSQIALTISSGKLTLFVNGASVGQGDVPAGTPDIDGEIHAGGGYQGLVDELDLAHVTRSAEWLRLTYAAESADAKLVATKTETAATESGGGSPTYFGILFKSLTPDAWGIIGILGVMFLIAVAVMVSKALYVGRTDKANRYFMQQFREASDVLAVGGPSNSPHENSSLYRLYIAGVRELTRRKVGQGGVLKISGAALDAIKAAVDADSVREGYALNSRMVLLTIAISGGPFLGLLGTVIGVMITFASIAAAGDVNVNAIAPGIAAALLATVAGLSVAIPSLFGYNYLASRIKTVSSDMQVFIDEFLTRVAETYGD
jgi:biopolymer transport protein ExbB